MKVNYEKIDDLNATLTIELSAEDYAPQVEKELRSMQKTIAIRGFRPGKAPIEMVKRFYGKSILAEEVQRMASDTLNNYLSEHNIDILGYPLSSERVATKFNPETDKDFVFPFDLGLAPSFELNIGKEDVLDLFQISVDDQEIDKDINYMRNRLGTLTPVEQAEAEDMISGTLSELNEQGEVMEGGVVDKPASLVAGMVQDEALKQQLIGVKPGAVLKVNIFQLFNNNDTVIRNTLGIQEEAVKDLNMEFQLQVNEIKRREPAELNEAYYQEIYGPENHPTNEEEYRQRVKENLERYYANEAELWLDHQISHLLTDKHKIDLPEAFLKRWLTTTKQETYNAENIDARFAEEGDVLRRQLVIEKIANAQNIQVTEDELRGAAYEYVADLYRQYGLMNAGNLIVDYAEKQLKDQDFKRRMADRVVQRKAFEAIRGMISLNPVPVSVEEYFSHVNEHKHHH